MTLLELHDVHVSYGKVQAIRGVSLRVEQGEIVTLIGANGAGKTTTLRAISGIRKASQGRIEFKGVDTVGVPAHELVVRGIGQSPEGRGIFPGMSVVENLEMGAYTRNKVGKKELAKDFERVYSLFPVLADRKQQAGGTMSGGEQQMLAIGRALMTHPELLLLDEPSMGLAPQKIQQIFEIVTEIREQGTTILMVEQNAVQALKRADRAYVIENGLITREGSGSELLADDSIRAAYLGGAH